MDIGTIFDWVGRVFGIAFLLFVLLILILPSWHDSEPQRHAPITQNNPGSHHDSDSHDIA